MWPKKSSKYSWPKAYGEIKSSHDEAFRAIDQAISLEEREKPQEVSINIIQLRLNNVFLPRQLKSIRRAFF